MDGHMVREEMWEEKQRAGSRMIDTYPPASFNVSLDADQSLNGWITILL